MKTYKIAFFLNALNHHQVHVADELYKLTGGQYAFVECREPHGQSNKGGEIDFSHKPYLIQAWKDDAQQQLAWKISEEAEVCVFGTIYSLPYEKHRLRRDLLSFEVSERWLKKGILNVFSSTISKYIWNYFKEGWYRKPLYKLCSSAYASKDHALLHTFKNRCYKWGYFTCVEQGSVDTLDLYSNTHKVRLMWCARFLKLKHPELPVQMAKALKDKGYDFVIDYYGAGEELEPTMRLAESLKVTDLVKFHGAVPNNEVLKAMRGHDVLLFTSNRLEGWGAVVNEAMSNGCTVVANDVIGSIPYLVIEGVTGLRYHETVESLTDKVEWLLNHTDDLRNMQINAHKQMLDVWSPANAAKSLLQLIDDLKKGKDCSIIDGPCSKA